MASITSTFSRVNEAMLGLVQQRFWP